MEPTEDKKAFKQAFKDTIIYMFKVTSGVVTLTSFIFLVIYLTEQGHNIASASLIVIFFFSIGSFAVFKMNYAIRKEENKYKIKNKN